MTIEEFLESVKQRTAQEGVEITIGEIKPVNYDHHQFHYLQIFVGTRDGKKEWEESLPGGERIVHHAFEAHGEIHGDLIRSSSEVNRFSNLLLRQWRDEEKRNILRDFQLTTAQWKEFNAINDAPFIWIDCGNGPAINPQALLRYIETNWMPDNIKRIRIYAELEQAGLVKLDQTPYFSNKIWIVLTEKGLLLREAVREKRQ